MTLVIPLTPPLSLVSQQVRETETWMPMKTTQTAAMLTHRDNLESSGDAPNGSDFGFTDDDEDEDDAMYDQVDGDDYYPSYDDEDEDDYDEFSGSGDGGRSLQILQNYLEL